MSPQDPCTFTLVALQHIRVVAIVTFELFHSEIGLGPFD